MRIRSAALLAPRSAELHSALRVRNSEHHLALLKQHPSSESSSPFRQIFCPTQNPVVHPINAAPRHRLQSIWDHGLCHHPSSILHPRTLCASRTLTTPRPPAIFAAVSGLARKG